MNLSIALIYPELLGTYGDRGNVLVLAHRAKRRGIKVEIEEISPGDKITDSAHIYLLGGGEDNAQCLATDLLKKQFGTIEAVSKKSQFVAVCAGFQILGNEFPYSEGKVHEGLGLIDVNTNSGSPRIIGEVVTSCSIDGIGKLTGFENHGGRTILGPTCKPLGIVETGKGNGIDTQSGFVDGFISEKIIATYLHGPLFARNPKLADYVLAKALEIELDSLEVLENDSAETLHRERLRAVT